MNLQLDATDDPVGRELLIQRARSFYIGAEYDRAISDCLAVLKIKPKAQRATALLADCYFCKRDFAKAVDLYTQAIALAPDDAHAHAWRGAAHCALGKLDKAVADYDEAIRLAPHKPTYYAARGTVHSWAGRQGLAMQDHDKAFALAGRRIDWQAEVPGVWVSGERYCIMTTPTEQPFRLYRSGPCDQVISRNFSTLQEAQDYAQKTENSVLEWTRQALIALRDRVQTLEAHVRSTAEGVRYALEQLRRGKRGRAVLALTSILDDTLEMGVDRPDAIRRARA